MRFFKTFFDVIQWAFWHPGSMDAWKDRRMDGRMDRWTDGPIPCVSYIIGYKTWPASGHGCRWPYTAFGLLFFTAPAHSHATRVAVYRALFHPYLCLNCQVETSEVSLNIKHGTSCQPHLICQLIHLYFCAFQCCFFLCPATHMHKKLSELMLMNDKSY